MKNLEWKAELRDPNLARILCKHIGATPTATIEQIDTYYNVASGRLKRRESTTIDGSGKSREPDQYIAYDRPDSITPKHSDYAILTRAEFEERYGSAPVPEWIVVSKRRELFMFESVRIHIDDVRELGWYFEFEIVLDEGMDDDRANRYAREIRATFAPALGEPIRVSYCDLLAQQRLLSRQQGE